KSGKNGMDNNTFKALNSKTYKTINFKLVSVSKITKTTDGNFTVETQGDLSIAGVTKRINQTFSVKVLGKKAVFSGKTKIDMTLYGVKPPTALMGTIKTGKDVTIDFKVTYN
uniref:YceI family protein n=2 Tax=Flavobacterium TaxID=237 RepID=UPI0040488B2A